jgi:hypothetical protein
MANDDIQGKITDVNGNEISGATVYLFSQDNTTEVISTTTDANGNYIFTGHPDGDGSSQNWHVVAEYDDGANRYNTRSKPYVNAQLSPTIPDSGNLQWRVTGTELSVAENDSVSTWGDQVGSNDLSANGGPIREDAINSTPTVRTDGVDDELVGSPLGSGAYTFGGVFRWRESDPASSEIIQNGDGDGWRLENRVNGGNNLYWTHSGQVAIDTGVAVSTNPVIIVVSYDPADDSLIIRIDGSEVVNTTAGYTDATSFLSVGSDNVTEFSNANHGEYLEYGVAQDMSTMQDIESWLDSQYGPIL